MSDQHQDQAGRPNHIDLPPLPAAPPASSSAAPDGQTGHDSVNPPEASATRPPPARGILKNSFRRPSNVGDGPIEPATDAERVQWDEANIAATEVGKDSLMCVLTLTYAACPRGGREEKG